MTTRRLVPLLAAVSVTLAFAHATQPSSAQTPRREPLIDWQGGRERARVTTEDGVVRLEGRPRSWIRSRRGANDLVLTIDFRLMTPDTRGAVIVRAWTPETNSFPRAGYRIALRARNSQSEAHGQIRGLSGRTEPAMHVVDVPATPGEWQHLEVRCEDDEILVWLNGQLAHSARGSEEHAGVVGIGIDEGTIEIRNGWITPLETRLPDGIEPIELPAHAVPPKPRRQIRPRYTADALSRGVEGVVILEAVVTTGGRPEAVHVIRSLIPDLDVEAVAAARQWRFDPATVDRRPVATAITIEMHFTIGDR